MVSSTELPEPESPPRPGPSDSPSSNNSRLAQLGQTSTRFEPSYLIHMGQSATRSGPSSPSSCRLSPRVIAAWLDRRGGRDPGGSHPAPSARDAWRMPTSHTARDA